MKDFWKMIIASMLLNLAIAFISPILAIFIQNIGEKNVIYVGYAFATVAITETIVSIYFGHISDKYGRKKFVVIGAILMTFVPFGYIFVTNIFQIIFLQFIAGIGLGMNSPTYAALLTEKMKKGRRGLGFGIFNSSTTLVAGIGALIGASIAQFLGFQALFISMGILELINVLILLTVNEK